MNCGACNYWQGCQYSKWADCYRVVMKLEPNLDGCYQDSEDRPGSEIYFTIPFDPHDQKQYWINHPFLSKLLRNAYRKASSLDGVRLEKVGGCTFIQTRRDYTCHGT
jgi:hypothetical protein